MTSSPAGAPESTPQFKLPRKDWLLLPALSMLTIAVLIVSTEAIARRVIPESGSVRGCVVIGDPASGSRAIPNSVCQARQIEAQSTEFRFNSCGHRAGMECGPKAPGAYRIVMAGSSVAFGAGVQREESFAALLPAELSRATGRRIELYNEGMGWGYPPRIQVQRFDEVLKADPDLILWILTPHDFDDPQGRKLALADPASQSQTPTSSRSTSDSGGSLQRFLRRARSALASRSVMDRVRDMWSQTRTATMVRHFLYESESSEQYVKSYLMNPDSDVGFLRATPSTQWQTDLRDIDGYAANIEERANAAGVPIVVVLVPNRAQAAMIASGNWPNDCDPYKLGQGLRSIVTSHGGTYIDILPGFRTIPDPEQYYFPVDGHPDAQGHAILSRLIAQRLTDGSIPSLTAASQTAASTYRENR